MSDKTIFDAKVVANLADNSTGAITPAKHREVLGSTNFSSKIPWKDEMSPTPLAFNYTRIADSTTPSAGEFSYNFAKNIISIHKTDGNASDLSAVFSKTSRGYINVIESGGTKFAILKISAIVNDGTIYVFSGVKIDDQIGTTTGSFIIDLRIESPILTADIMLTGTQILGRAGQINATTSLDNGDFSFDVDDPSAAVTMYYKTDSTNIKNMLDSFLMGGVDIQLAFRPIDDPTDFFIIVADADTISWTGTVATITIIDTDYICGTLGDYTLYEHYIIELLNF